MVANTLPAYFFGLAIGQLVYGPLSDRIGRKASLFWACALCSCKLVLRARYK